MIVLAFTPEEFSTLTLALQVYSNHLKESGDVLKADRLSALHAERVKVAERMLDAVITARAR